MKRIVIVLSIVLSTICTSYSGELRQAGQSVIKYAKNGFDRDNVKSVILKNDDLQVVCKLYSGKFVDEYALYAIPWITNLAGKGIKVSYHAAFFDKNDQLVASIYQSADIPADASGHQLGSSMAFIPKSSAEKITSYKLVMYTTDATSRG